MGALRLLAGAQLDVPFKAHAPGAFETVVPALVEVQPAVLEMKDLLCYAVQEIAVVADDEHRALVLAEIVLEPERGLEIEVIGRLVEQQQVGLGEQQGRECYAHAPAPRERLERPLLRRVVEPEPVENAGSAGRRAVRVLVAEALVDFCDAHGIRGAQRLVLESDEFAISGQHRLNQAPGSRGCLLKRHADAPALGNVDSPVIGLQSTGNQAEKGGLPGAVAPDEPHAVTGVDHRARPGRTGHGRRSGR